MKWRLSNMRLIKHLPYGAALIIDRIEGNYVYIRFIDMDGVSEAYQRYLYRRSDGKDYFKFGVCYHKIADFKPYPA